MHTFIQKCHGTNVSEDAVSVNHPRSGCRNYCKGRESTQQSRDTQIRKEVENKTASTPFFFEVLGV